MDPDISGWILEFLMKQSTIIDDETLNNIIHILPLPIHNPRFKKSLILHIFDFDIKTGTISNHTLDLLESIIELDISQQVYNPSEALKLAYGTLAMYCTIKSIENDDIEAKCDVLKRLWSERVREMEECGNVIDEMLSWVKAIEARIMEVDVCECVLEMFGELDVAEVLSRYVSEAREMMGPSFIEVAYEMVLSDTGLSKELGLDGGVSGEALDADVRSEGNEASKACVLPQNKQISHISYGRSDTHRGAKIVDPIETSHDRCYGVPTPEVDRVKKALEKSSSELNAVVKDPLPEALRYAESLNVKTCGENMARDHDVGGSTRNNDKVPSSSHDRKGKVLEADGGEGLHGDQNERRKPSLMERNSTAHTVEWSDSIEDSDVGLPTGPQLNTPRKRSIINQRKRRRWTVVEEETLRTGVHKTQSHLLMPQQCKESTLTKTEEMKSSVDTVKEIGS